MIALDDVLDRQVLAEHDGRSGARIETGRLADGTRVFVKHADVATDLGALLTGSARRELDLLEAGVFDRLPAGVATAVLGIEERDGVIVTITRDLTGSILDWSRILTAGEVRVIFGRMASVHDRFAGAVPSAACPLATRLGLFGPANVEVRPGEPPLFAAVRRGQELFADLVPSAVADAVERSLRDPAALAAALSRRGTTLLHGDFWFVNLALDGDVLVPLDWGLATDGPPIVDFVTFCVGATSNVALSRDALLAEAADACGLSGDDDTIGLASLWALMELGWNKALDVVDHPDGAKRATEHADLDFWVERAMVALDRGLVP